jgi:nucleoside-diphosphate-sugar epimerase
MKRTSRPKGRVALVTGFPSILASRMIRRIAAEAPDTTIRFLALEKFQRDADALVKELASQGARRVEPLEGDIARMDMGLAGREWTALCAEITDVHHIAAIHFLGVDPATLEAVNVGGTREVVDLCKNAPRLLRLHFWSTAMVSGDRHGVVRESEVDCGQGFHNEYERTKLAAEKVLRRLGGSLPFTVYRPSHVVGDSRTGEIDRFDGPYHIITGILRSPIDVALPLPTRADAPLHLVPVDYVIDAAWAIGQREDARGATVHLVDPQPLPAREVFSLVAKVAHRREPRGFIPAPVTRALLRAPGVERLGRSTLGFVETMATDVTYDASVAQELLAGSGIECPRFESYVETLVAWVRDKQRRERGARQRDEAPDPLM